VEVSGWAFIRALKAAIVKRCSRRGRVVQDVTLAPDLFDGADEQPISIMSKIHRAEEWAV